MVFVNDPLETRIEKAAKIGFKCAEMWFVDMTYRRSPENLAEVARKNGVRITNTVIGAPDGSVGGGLTDPSCRERWLERARLTFAFNRAAGIPATIVCTGNTVEGATPEQMQQSVVDGLKATANLAEEAGINLLLEPLNTTYDHPGYFLTSSDAGADICRQVGSENLKLLFDCYHMQIMEGDLLQHIQRNLDTIGHFHSAGVPGRNELYKGETAYPFVVEAIEKMGYQGVFGLEYAPSIDDERSLRNTLEYLKTP
jgi:hydroxypyruvate isomerase